MRIPAWHIAADQVVANSGMVHIERLADCCQGLASEVALNNLVDLGVIKSRSTQCSMTPKDR